MTKHKPIYICYILLFLIVVGLGIGYSTFSARLQVEDTKAYVRRMENYRITGFSLDSVNSNAVVVNNYMEFSERSLISNIKLPNSSSYVKFKVSATNLGNTYVAIHNFTNLNSDLQIELTGYNYDDKICNGNNCTLNATKDFYITIKYKNGVTPSNNAYNINLGVNFVNVYTITYIGFSNTGNLPGEIIDGETKTVTFTNNTGIPAGVSTNNATGSYANPTLTLSNAIGNVVVARLFSITYVDFPGDTSGLTSMISSGGGTITFNSTSGIPVLLTVTGANSNYDSSTHILSLTNVTSNVTITMASDGNVEITSITQNDILNVTENNPPQISNDGKNITFDLGITADETYSNKEYYVTYAIAMYNDSVYEQKVLATNFTPNIVGTGTAPNVTYEITDANGNPVLNTTMTPKTSQTYYLTINIEPQEEGTWGVEGETGVETVQNGTITGSISGSNQGNLAGSNTTAHFTASVTNSYDESKSFILSIDDNKFDIVDSNGNAISSMTIAANTTDTFDFYIKNMNGNNFMSSPYELNINLNHDNNVSSIGIVSLTVDIDPNLTDTTAPIITSVTATTTSTEKEILVTFTGTDDNVIDYYYVETYTSDANGNGTLYHTETLAGAANGVQVTYTATVPEDDDYYFFKVYAKDRAKNIANANDISSCSTSSGHCMRTSNEKYKWNFIVTLVLTNATSSKGTVSTSGNVNTYTINATYDSNVNTTLSGASNYDPPNTISAATITYPNGTSGNLQSGNSSQTAYNYNTSSHALNIYHIKGDIRIEASGRTCLVEGTKILLADGSYKNIEDIGYDDLLAVWNYDTGKLTYEYPLWIENEHVSNQVIRVTFTDGKYIDFVGNHALYNTDKNLFVNILDGNDFKIGTNVAKLENNKLVNAKVKNIETINKKVKYYFVGSTTYYNIFANDILTTDQNLMISNLYGFDDGAKWPKEKKQILENENNLLDYSYFEDVLPYYLYKGFRVREAGYLVNNGFVKINEFKNYITTSIVNPEVLRKPITISNDRYWMVTTSENNVNRQNKKKYLRKEGSMYTLPNSKIKDFKGWYNTSDNNIYQPGDKISVSHGIHFIALYDEKKSTRLYLHHNIYINNIKQSKYNYNYNYN